MGPFCQLDAPAPGPVAGSEDEVLLTAPEIYCPSQITVTKENSSSASLLRQILQVIFISEIRSAAGACVPGSYFGDLATYILDIYQQQ